MTYGNEIQDSEHFIFNCNYFHEEREQLNNKIRGKDKSPPCDHNELLSPQIFPEFNKFCYKVFNNNKISFE
jgi:hypothetical protein